MKCGVNGTPYGRGVEIGESIWKWRSACTIAGDGVYDGMDDASAEAFGRTVWVGGGNRTGFRFFLWHIGAQAVRGDLLSHFNLRRYLGA
jgi:hypothetical protein